MTKSPRQLEKNTGTRSELAGIAGLFIVAAISCGGAWAGEEAPGETSANADTSGWICEFCPFPSGLEGSVDVGAGHVSDDSFKFGDYRGLEDDGVFPILNGELNYWGDNGKYWSLSVTDLGLDSRSVKFEAGRQGSFQVNVNYDELPKLNFETTRTPFLGVGGSNLMLPTGWVAAGSTSGMTSLPTSLNTVEIEQERKTLGAGFSLIRWRQWDYKFDVRHETREGINIRGGSFSATSSLLPTPVDYETDEVEFSAAYSQDKWNVSFAYYGSFFSNDESSLAWENPFTAFVAGAERGQQALPPDNSFQQVSVSGGYRVADRTSLLGTASIGRGEQDDSFLPYTTNTSIVTSPLPRTSFDGKVDTFNVNLRLSSNPFPKFNYTAKVSFDERDNGSPQALYEPVEGDTFLSVPEVNLPYSYERYDIEASANYRVFRWAKVHAGAGHEVYRRTFQEVSRTEEDSVWGRIDLTLHGRAKLSFHGRFENRDASPYQVLTVADAPQNPLLRKFNMASGERDSAGLTLSVTPHDRINLGFNAEYAEEDFETSAIGLVENDHTTFTLDVSALLADKISLYGLLSHEDIAGKQFGSQGFSTPDWKGRNDDTINSIGLGVRATAIKDKFDINFDYMYSDATGQTQIDPGFAARPFPDLVTRLNSAKLYVTWPLKTDLNLRVGWYYEKYRSTDWMLDGVVPTTISNILSLGAQSPDYSINVLSVSARYRFGGSER